MEIVYLTVSSWEGISLGAEHCYGTLTAYRPHKSHKLQKTLSAQEASALNAKDGYDSYQAGDETERFDSEAEVVQAALQSWQQHFPGTQVLIQGLSASADPQKILMAPQGLLETGNELFARAEEVGFWDGDPDRMEEISNQWDALFRLYGSC